MKVCRPDFTLRAGVRDSLQHLKQSRVAAGAIAFWAGFVVIGWIDFITVAVVVYIIIFSAIFFV